MTYNVFCGTLSLTRLTGTLSEYVVCVVQYIVERHADTLLPQYLGMYRITINDSETYIVVIRNIFSARLTIHRKYDLKVWIGLLLTFFQGWPI